jgi:hypothetical protein
MRNLQKKSIFYAIAFVLLTMLPALTQNASGESFLQSRFNALDSVLSALPQFPEVRAKEVAPVNGLFGKLLTQYPEIVLIIRTGSKGVVVNYANREGDDRGFGADVSDSAWYASPKTAMSPWYGKLTKEHRRSILLWSRPFSIRAPVGGERFGGVVALKIDVTTCFKEFAAQEKGPFQILLNGQSYYYLSWYDSIPFAEQTITVPGGIKFTVRLPKNAGEKTMPGARGAVLSKQGTIEDSSVQNAGREVRKPANDKEPAQAEDTASASGEEVPSNKTLSHGDLWLWLLAIAVLLAVTVFGGLLYSRMRRRRVSSEAGDVEKNAVPHLVEDQGQESEAEELVNVNEDLPKKTAVDIQPADENVKEPEEESGGERASVVTVQTPALITVPDTGAAAQSVLTAEDRQRIMEEEKKKAEERYAGQIKEDALRELRETITRALHEEHAGRLRASAEEELKNELKQDILNNEKEALSQKARQEAEQEIRTSVEQEFRETLLAQMREELASQVKKQIEEREKDKIYEKELESLTSAVRRQLVEKEMPALVEEHRRRLSGEIKAEVAASLTDEYREQAAAALKKETAEAVLKEDGARIRDEETVELRESLRLRLAEEEEPKLAAKALDSLAAEIRDNVERNEGAVLRERILAELTDEIRTGLVDKEQDAIRGQQREKLERELYAEIAGKERDGIREALLARITQEEHARIESGERENIIKAEISRLIARESPALREQLRSQIRKEEMETIKEAVKAEIYSETVQVIRNSLEEKYKAAIQEKLAELKKSLAAKARADIRAGFQKEYLVLIDKMEQVSGILTGDETLRSLGKTVSLLSEEKKKYKYLNLNAAQTESLLDYLRRMHSRFTIHLDKVDQSVRELMLSLGNVKTKLNKEE